MNAPITLHPFAVEMAITTRYVVVINAPTSRHAEGVAYGLSPAQIVEHGQPIRNMPPHGLTVVESLTDTNGTRIEL